MKEKCEQWIIPYSTNQCLWAAKHETIIHNKKKKKNQKHLLEYETIYTQVRVCVCVCIRLKCVAQIQVKDIPTVLHTK